MKPYYFTFGTGEEYPFYGGWVKVMANDRGDACEKYRARFPDRDEGFVNCAFIYSEPEFTQTRMAASGNYGFFCHEIIE